MPPERGWWAAGWGSKYAGQGKREEIYFRCKGYVIFCTVAGWGRVSRRQLAGVIEELGLSLRRVGQRKPL